MNRTAKITTGVTVAVVVAGLVALVAPVVIPFLPQRVQVALVGTIHTVPGSVDDLYRATGLLQYDDGDSTVTHADVDAEYVAAAKVWPWSLPDDWGFPAKRGVSDTPGHHFKGMGVKAAFSKWSTASLDAVKSGTLTPDAANHVLDEVQDSYQTLLDAGILTDAGFIEDAVSPLRH